jgi:HAD superfamily hydrolase (TIGR01490 family)
MTIAAELDALSDAMMGGEARPVPRIAIFDLDGTITRTDTFLRFLILAFRRTPARWPRAPLLGIAVLLFAAKQRSNSWLKTFFLRQIIGGRPRQTVDACVRAHVEATLTSHVLDPALAEIDRLKHADVRLVLASASPDVYVEALARRLGFDEVLCTRVGRDDSGAWTGTLDGDNCYGAEKKRRVDAYLADVGATWGDVAFYSDHHSDLPLIEAAATRFAVNPTQKLARVAAEKGVTVLDWATVERAR